MKTSMLFWLYVAQSSLEWKMLQTKFIEKIKTQVFMFSYFFFFFENEII